MKKNAKERGSGKQSASDELKDSKKLEFLPVKEDDSGNLVLEVSSEANLAKDDEDLNKEKLNNTLEEEEDYSSDEKKEESSNSDDNNDSENPKISRWKRILNSGSVKQKEILFFTKNVSVLLKAGSTLSESLEVLQKQAKGKFFYVLTDVNRIISRGMKFSEALAKHPKVFTDIYVNIIKTGEDSGNLAKNLEYIAMQLEKSYELRKKIIGAMIYPAVVLTGTLALGFGIVFFVLPQITKLFKNFTVELPFTTRLLISIGDFFQGKRSWSIVVLVVFVVFFFWLLRKKFVKPVTHFLILHIPIVKSVSKHLNLSYFYRNLSVLLSSGITIDEALETCSKTVTNYYYKKFLRYVHEEVNAGSNLTTLLREKSSFFPDTDVQIVSVGEESGTLSDTLLYAAEIHEEEVDDITKNLSNILEPILLIVLGLMVGTLALSIITPIYSITQQFN